LRNGEVTTFWELSIIQSDAFAILKLK